MRIRSPNPAEIPRLLNAEGRGTGWPLLRWLADARYLTNDLVALRYYPTPAGVRSASYRMAQLADWGLIVRRHIRGHRQVWHLTDQGAKLVSEHLGVTLRELGYDGREGYIHEGRIHHALAVTRLEVALEVHARQNGGTVTRFVREPVLHTDAGVLRPDAGLTYTNGTRTWTYLIEVDRNTETPAFFAATKAPKYDAMARGGVWQLLFEDMPTCLVVAASGGVVRTTRLKMAIDALPVGDGDYRLYKFAAAEELYHMPLSVDGNLPEIVTNFDRVVCLAARKPETERRAVFA